ncbi:MAG: glycoside hydrolase family 2 protein [Bacteroidales bacterium]|nr:glycoside hydrolase family 2 protein [Bacteroidales bacterium]
MKRIITVAAALVLSLSAFAGKFLNLSGEWRLDIAGKDAPRNLAVTVPGDVHSALLEAGLIKDPYYAFNELDNLWVGREDWVFSRTFVLDASFLAHEAVYLRAEDVDIFCDISINGHNVGSTTNRFRRWEWDVKPYLRAGENVIEGYFHSAWNECEKVAAGYDYPMPMSEVGLVPDINTIRKPTCHGGWDWGPCQMVTGFAGPLELIAVDAARIDYVYCDQDFSRKGRVGVKVNVEITSPAGGSSVVSASFAGQKKSRKVKLAAGGNIVSFDFAVRNPRLWWPNGMGEQYLYPLEVAVEGCRVSKKIGLRQVEVVNYPDTVYGKEGMCMTFRINGRDMFAKGADWVPCELFESRQTYERYADFLTSARDANMNMLRHWGGGQFEHEEFYNICDSLGLMLWHDFMFSCAIYPADKRFLDEVEAELNHQLRRLRDHSCIAMWCGDNECVGALGWWDVTRKNRHFYTSKLDTLIKLRGRVVAEVDPARVYWPSSPCAGPGDYQTDNWKEDTKGDMHLWSVSKFAGPLSDYYKIRPRFCSEIGHSSFPRYDLVAKYSSPGAANPWSPEFEHHVKEVTDGRRGNQIIMDRLRLHFNFPNRMEDLCYLSQVEQAMGLETCSQYWRTLEPNCMGVIYWQLNDIWPGTSWASVEYDGKWKQSHYHAKRFFAPEIITAVPSWEDGDKLGIWVVNDTASDKEYTAVVRLWTFEGEVVCEKNFPVSVVGDSSVMAAEFSLNEFGDSAARNGRFMELQLLYRNREVAYNTWLFDEFKNSPLEKAAVSCNPAVRDGRWTVTLTTDKPAFFTWLGVGDIPGEFNDNSFTLYPGRSVELVFTPKNGFTDFDKFVSSLSVTHLSETYL